MARILVVDDRPLNRSLLVTLLGYGGHDLVEAGDGAEALEAALAQLPDLIITDILMPTMDGVTLVHHLRADPRFAAIPVIFHTATYRLSEAKTMAQACGVQYVLAKPCDPEEILFAVNAALGLPTSPPIAGEALDMRPLGFVGEHLGPYLRDLHELNARIAAVVSRGADLVGRVGPIMKTAVELSEALGGMERVSLRLSALIEAGMDLTAERDPAALLKQFCRVAQNILCARFAVLGIPHETGEGFKHQITHGLPPGQMQPFCTQPDFLRQILLDRKERQLKGSAEMLASLGLPPGHPPFHSLLAVPLASPTRVYGWLYLVDRLGAEAFSDEDQMIASTLCNQLAITYENLLLLEDLQNQIRQRILAEEAGLRLSEIVEASEDAIVSVDVNHRITNWSRGAEQLFGYAAWEILGQPLSILAPPELWEEQANSMGALNRGTQLPPFETSRLRKGGAPVQVAVQTTPVRNMANVVIGFSAIMRDITGRRAMEKALLNTAVQLQNVFNNIDEVIWSYDPMANRMLEISPACEGIYGYPPQAFFERPSLWLEGIHPQDQPLVEEQMARLGRGLPAQAEYRIRRPDGTLRWVLSRGKPRRDDSGCPLCIDGTVSDISERKRMEEELETRATQLNNVFQNVDEMLWSFDPRRQRILTLSPACERIYGQSIDSLFEDTSLWVDAVHPEDRPAAIASFQQLLDGIPIEREERILHPDGEIRWVVVKARPSMDASGLVIRIDGSVSDVTESRRFKERMAMQERLAALGTLLGTVAHDLRNPLMSITTASETLELNTPPSEYLTHHLDQTRRASRRIMGLLDELLDFATPKPLNLMPSTGLDLLQEASEACERLAKHLGVDVVLEQERGSGTVVVDHLRMHHVLRNILENAIQHSPSRGTVRLISRTAGGSWLCTIQDEGSGIAKEDLPFIFDPLFSRRSGGTGLGLAIAHRIVQQHGGQLEVENGAAGGARFTIRIPQSSNVSE